MPKGGAAATLGESGTALGEDFVLGGSNIVGDTKVYGAGSGRTISFEITHSGADQPWRVGRIDPQIQVNGEDSGDASSM